MYQHQCALLVDELVETERMLRRTRANIAGLAQMNDLLVTGKMAAESALAKAHERIAAEPDNLSFRPIDLVTEQRDHLHRENQRLLLELSVLRGPQP